MRCLPPGLGAATSTERQPSMASCKLRRSSSIVSPCVAQPGMAGTSAQKPPFVCLVHDNLDLHTILPVDRRKIGAHACNAKAELQLYRTAAGLSLVQMILRSFPRKRESSLWLRIWVPAFAGTSGLWDVVKRIVR